ncbi:MAG: TlpA disulfide reductase family protein [Treponemataceae bacterium]
MKRFAILLFVPLLFLAGTQRVEAVPKAATSPASILATLGFSVFPEAQPIPAFTLRMVDGKSISIGDLKGKYVFLNFWATWCPPCQKEMPSMEALYAKFGKKNFAMLAVSVREDPKTVEKFLSSKKYSFPIALDPDGAVSAMFVGRGIPTTYILDPQGRAIAGLVGGREWNTSDAIDAFSEILEK